MERTIRPLDLKEQLAAGSDLILLDVRRKADYDADPEKLPVEAMPGERPLCRGGWRSTCSQN